MFDTLPLSLVPWLLLVAGALVLMISGRVRIASTMVGAVLCCWPLVTGEPPTMVDQLIRILFGAFLIVGYVAPIRRLLITRILMKKITKILPAISDTEREALEGGTVWWDGEIFSGSPDWDSWFSQGTSELTVEEKEFLEGPVAELVHLVDNWKDRQNGTISDEVFEFLAKHGFFGMIIPKRYGGLGFSAAAMSAVISRTATISNALSITIMVPNSLGPGELLLHFGTEEQKATLLPRLASGEEIPCFALTEPEAGSDAAGSMKSHGVIVEQQVDGKTVLGIRLNWEKRYITLAPRATLIGVAFRLYDPDHLLGEQDALGITCALIPAHLEGVETGQRHDPLGVPFLNGPTSGRDVFVPLDAVIGGEQGCGKGWRMLMKSLSAGRGISLPSSSAGGAQLCLRVAGAHASVREQFGLPIGRFEGVQEPLVRSAASSYSLDALRLATTLAVDSGEKPAVISAVAKAFATERLRDIVNDCMDIVAGNAICRGPRNVLANAYSAVPVGITVEGANILTRTMIIFGQGAIRCHPHVTSELEAIEKGDSVAFDRAFWGHVGFVFANSARSLVHRISGYRFCESNFDGPIGRCQQRIGGLSAHFALATDFAMATLGGSLKRKEHLTGRLADALTWMTVASVVLKKFHDDSRPHVDADLVRYQLETCVLRSEEALAGFVQNLPLRPASWLLRLLGVPARTITSGPSDQLADRIAAELLDGSPLWQRLTADVVPPPAGSPGLATLEFALEKVVASRPDSETLKSAIRSGKLAKRPTSTLTERGLAAGVIDEQGQKRLEEADEARRAAIAVDVFAAGVSPAAEPYSIDTSADPIAKEGAGE
ncbi:MAG: acyl-CoA dehydrogenase [Planctomycetota bacterium]